MTFGFVNPTWIWGLLPLLGFVIDMLEGMNFGMALTLAGSIVMAVAAVRISGYQRKAK